MDNIGGEELVGLILARELNADFYTTNIDREKIDIISDKKPQDYVKKYALGGNIEQQLEWKEPLRLEGQQQRGFGGGGGRTGGRRTGA